MIGGESLEEEPLRNALLLRLSKLSNPTDPFPPPSDKSKNKVLSGSVYPHLRQGDATEPEPIPVLEDTVEAVWAISTALDLDEVDSYILLRLFIRDQGLTPNEISHIPSLIDAITEFYFDERIHVLRIMGALLQIRPNHGHQWHSLAAEILAQAVPDDAKFLSLSLDRLRERSKAPIRPQLAKDMRSTAKWAKQGLKEQLCVLEVMFWAAFSLNANGKFVLDYFTTAYETDLGTNQKYKDFLLDEECTRIRLDIEALFVFTIPNLLKVDRFLAEPLDMDLISHSRHGYLASPSDVQKIHHLVMDNTPLSHRYSPILLAWGYVLNKLTDATTDEIPQGWEDLASLLNPPQRGAQGRLPDTPSEMPLADVCVKQAVDQQLLQTLRAYLSEPIMSLVASNMLGSTLTDPGGGSFKYSAKCMLMF